MKLKINTIFLKKILRTLGENTFPSILFLFLLATILSSLIFYKYVILVKKIEPEISGKPLLVEEETYQDILMIWQEREMKSQQADLKQYLNPFQGLTK